MSAVEIYDPKMDLKAKLEESITLEYAIKNKNIIMPDDLSVEDQCGLFDELLTKEVLWLRGLSLPHTVYACSYLYDPTLYENHKFLKPYIDGLYAGGAIC